MEKIKKNPRVDNIKIRDGLLRCRGCGKVYTVGEMAEHAVYHQRVYDAVMRHDIDLGDFDDDEAGFAYIIMLGTKNEKARETLFKNYVLGEYKTELDKGYDKDFEEYLKTFECDVRFKDLLEKELLIGK